MAERLRRFFEHIKLKYGSSTLTNMSMRMAIDRYRNEFDSMVRNSPQSDMLDGLDAGLRERLCEFCLHSSEVYNGSNAEDMAASSMDTFIPEADKHVMDGYSKIVEGMGAGLDVRFRHIVQRIEYRPTTVSNAKVPNVVVMSDCGTFHARYCVVTVPLGILKSQTIEFVPPLPSHKRNVIERFGFGIMNKIVLQFESPCSLWDGDTELIAMLRDGDPRIHEYGWLYNIDNLFPGSALYVWYVGGKFAEQIEDSTSEDIAKNVLRLLNRAREGHAAYSHRQMAQLPPLKRCRVTRWRGDIFSRGAYGFISVGSTLDDCDVLAEPVGEFLGFAGESLSKEYLGMVNGAYETGTNEASRVLASMNLHMRSRSKL